MFEISVKLLFNGLSITVIYQTKYYAHIFYKRGLPGQILTNA